MTMTHSPNSTFEDLPSRLNYFVREYTLSDDELALLMSTSPVSVAHWRENHSRPSAPVTMTVLRVLDLLDELGRLLSADGVRLWLFSGNPALDSRQPAEVIAAGGYDEVEALMGSWSDQITGT